MGCIRGRLYHLLTIKSGFAQAQVWTARGKVNECRKNGPSRTVAMYKTQLARYNEPLKTVRMMQRIPTTLIIFADAALAVALIAAAVWAFDIRMPSFAQALAESEIVPTARAFAAQCNTRETPNKEDCYVRVFSELIRRAGFPSAEKVLFALQDIDEMTKSCHVLAHQMGRTALREDPEHWKELAEAVNVQACGSGFLHGVLEAHVGDDPTFVMNAGFANDVCNKGKDPYRDRMCSHFMGHVALLEKEGDIPEALPICDGVVPELRFDCYNGLFMEDHQKLALAEHEVAPLPRYTPEYAAELEAGCNAYDGERGNACWTEMAEVYAKVWNYDAQEIQAGCGRAPNDAARRACMGKGGVILITYPLERTPQQLTMICAPDANDPVHYRSCTSGLISALMYYSPKFTSRGIALCANIPAEHREWCFTDLGNQLSRIVPNAAERAEYCASASDEYRPRCVRPGNQ